MELIGSSSFRGNYSPVHERATPRTNAPPLQSRAKQRAQPVFALPPPKPRRQRCDATSQTTRRWTCGTSVGRLGSAGASPRPGYSRPSTRATPGRIANRRVMRMSADPADALSSAVLMPETALRNARSWSRSRSSSIKRYCATAAAERLPLQGRIWRTARRSRAPRSALVTRSAPWLREESAFLASVVRLRHNK